MKILVDEIDKCIFECGYEDCILNPNGYCFVRLNEKCPYLKEFKPAEDDCK